MNAMSGPKFNTFSIFQSPMTLKTGQGHQNGHDCKKLDRSHHHAEF